MKMIFGPHTREVHELVTDLRELSSGQLAAVTRAWQEGSESGRARAWAELHHTASDKEWQQILAAASVARRQAMDVAQVLNKNDWAFWAAAWDAAAAITGADRIGSHYDVLTAPLSAVLPSLSLGRGDVQIPAQRTEEQQTEEQQAAEQQAAEQQAAEQQAAEQQAAEQQAAEQQAAEQQAAEQQAAGRKGPARR